MRLVVIRAGREHVDRIVLAAWLAQKEGGLLALGVPAWADEDLATEYFGWLTSELKRRDDGVWRIHYRPSTDGSFMFAIEDIDFNPKGA